MTAKRMISGEVLKKRLATAVTPCFVLQLDSVDFRLCHLIFLICLFTAPDIANKIVPRPGFTRGGLNSSRFIF
jgi:hypothetical protein